jgi:hypothetical protein
VSRYIASVLIGKIYREFTRGFRGWGRGSESGSGRRPQAGLGEATAVLHFLADADDLAGVVATLAATLAPGSFVAIPDRQARDLGRKAGVKASAR